MIYFLKNMKKFRLYFFMLILLCLLISITAIITSKAMGILTSIAGAGLFKESMPAVIFTLVSFLADGAVCLCYRAVCGQIHAELYCQLQEKFLSHLSGLSSDSPLLKHRGDLFSRISTDSSDTVQFFSAAIPQIMMQGTQLILTAVYMFIISRPLSFIYLLTLFLSLALQFFFTKSLKKISNERKCREVGLNTCLKDIIGHRSIIKTYETRELVSTLCRQEESRYFRAQILFYIRSAPMQMAGLLCGIIPSLSLCLAGIYLIPKGLLTSESFMSVFYLCQRILPGQLHYIDLFINAVKTKASLTRTKEFLHKTEKVPHKSKGNLHNPTLSSCTIYPKPADIVLKNIYYRYPGSHHWAAENISLHIPHGKKVAFIGESGSGKSTVLKLIGGLLTPAQGTLHLPESVLCGQFPHFFPGTIRDNLLCFQKESSALDKACLTAMTDIFTSNLNDGLDTLISGQTKQFSGGQLQRLALARALNAASSTILLDEAVSALDAQTAKKVVEGILQNYPAASLIMVLHQPELLSLMDEIYVFSHGKITAHGSYSQLCENNIL